MLRLREERLKNNLTMKQVGAIIGVTEASVSLYETGKREPSSETLSILADLYGVSVDYLLGREDSHPPMSESEQIFQHLIKELRSIPDSEYSNVIKYVQFLKQHSEDGGKL